MFKYDLAGNRQAAKRYQFDAAYAPADHFYLSKQQDYVYDANDRLLTMDEYPYTLAGGTPQMAGWSQKAYTYNANGSTTERTYDGTGQPGSVTYSYDLRGRLVEVASQTP